MNAIVKFITIVLEFARIRPAVVLMDSTGEQIIANASTGNTQAQKRVAKAEQALVAKQAKVMANNVYCQMRGSEMVNAHICRQDVLAATSLQLSELRIAREQAGYHANGVDYAYDNFKQARDLVFVRDEDNDAWLSAALVKPRKLTRKQRKAAAAGVEQFNAQFN